MSRADDLERCLRCGRHLSAPRSVTRGFGETCWRRVPGYVRDTVERHLEDNADFLERQLELNLARTGQ